MFRKKYALIAVENISLASRISGSKSRRPNRTDQPKIRTPFKFERKIKIAALQESKSQPISSNSRSWGIRLLRSTNPPGGLVLRPSYNCTAIATPPMGGRRDVAPLCGNGDLESFARTYIVFRGETAIASYWGASALCGSLAGERNAPNQY